uniref:DUF4468 domain-containing protein n=1 Tax=Pedobacter schmidteae TaxID=2201271 RepID=UPI000EB53E9D|nr:DUF4468 domain-containing protein [Pedobacter schmidteae]
MKLSALITFVLFGVVCFGQEKPLATDERGKLICYEVVVAKDIPKDSLTARAVDFLKKSVKTMKPKSATTDSLIHATGKMIINKTALVLSRPSGEVQYHFYAEAKDGKYRFWLTDFVFIPYQRDRYGNFVPATTVGTPLENKPGKLNAAEWNGYVKATTKAVNAFAERFKAAMKDRDVVPPVVKAVPVGPGRQW